MNTPFILNTVASTQQAARPATMADSFSADVPFNQVLNKEVSNRNNDTRDKPRDVVRERHQPNRSKPHPGRQQPDRCRPDCAASQEQRQGCRKKAGDDEDGRQ